MVMIVNLYLKKCLLLALGFVLCIACVMGQQKKKVGKPRSPEEEGQPYQPTQAELDRIEKSCSCARRKGAATALRVYPFNKAVQVQLVSFETGRDLPPDTTSEGFLILKPPGMDSLPRVNGSVCLSAMHEVKVLTYGQADILADIIFNYDFAKDPAFDNGTRIGSIKCHDPHNAILFVDDAGKVFEYMSVCFECGSLRASFAGWPYDDFMCRQKMSMIKKVFEKAGIQLGVTEEPRH